MPMSFSDVVLIDSVRCGDVQAYGELYRQHADTAYGLARKCSRDPADAEDLVAEAFVRILAALLAGHGPDSSFRAYLCTTLRHLACDKARRDRRLQLVEDFSALRLPEMTVPATDTAVAEADRSRVARAFNGLPRRWQLILWHTEIEGQTPAKVAPILGLTPNSVSALACRARAGLRDAYFQPDVWKPHQRR
jgi:RNA polymerase sigma factor (sigma-70 family)